jgi:ribosomal protein S18 acetylase RimI-like enzyme
MMEPNHDALTFKSLSTEDLAQAQSAVAQFLFQHLGEFGDPLDQIQACLDYVLNPDKGGRVFLAVEGAEIVGAVVINDTGMSGYIPEHILVYIAVHERMRGQGVGKTLMQAAIANSPGNMALHVEPHNPALRLYERLGFENKYLEMRHNKQRSEA